MANFGFARRGERAAPDAGSAEEAASAEAPAPPDHASQAATKRAEARTQVAQKIAALADKTASRTKEASAKAVSAGKVGLSRAARVSRESVLPELGRVGAKLRERTRPDRLGKDYRSFLQWLHEKVLDESIEPLFFAPTKGRVPLDGLTVNSPNRSLGHDYRPTPYFLFKWALSAVEAEDIGRLTFVDHGAGKGRVLLLASHFPFAAIRGVEFAAELHDDAVMNIAQFPRSRMKCRKVECTLEDALNAETIAETEAVHYFFNPFSMEVFAELLRRIVASYHAKPRRLYLVLIDMDAGELIHKTGVFRELQLGAAEGIQARLLSPYKIAVYRSLA